MNELERQLTQLPIAVPDTPDLAPAVLARLEGRPFPWRRVAVVALAVLAVAVIAAFAVPQARTTILRWFHLGGSSVERVETLPRAGERRAGDLGKPLSLEAAVRAIGFRLRLPAFKDGQPRRAYVVDDALATVVIRAYGTSALLSEFRSFGPETLHKLATDKTDIEPIRINGRPGLWLQGGPHTLRWYDATTGFRERMVQIRGNVLLWLDHGLILRLEGKLTKAQALAIARTVG